ncbi:MAG TPA: OsmC family protein [Thermoanaerobaculia bacterium]|nr:OsmC family protein [Thermoanaerobaculia bacterium]
MPVRKADAVWEGGLKGGHGKVSLGSGAWSGPYSFASRFADGQGSNPEELIGAAHAGCFAMALSAALDRSGHVPRRVAVSAAVHLETGADGPRISRIDLRAEADVPGIDDDAFQQQARQAKEGCPVSKALAGTEITLDARLVGGPAGTSAG